MEFAWSTYGVVSEDYALPACKYKSDWSKGNITKKCPPEQEAVDVALRALHGQQLESMLQATGERR